MLDAPAPADLVKAVAELLRRDVMPALEGHLAFQTRVAINALELVIRQSETQAPRETAERARLAGLLGREAPLAELNAALAQAIAAGDMDLSTPGLSEHLWTTTMDKLAVDQPRHAAYGIEAARKGRDAP